MSVAVSCESECVAFHCFFPRGFGEVDALVGRVIKLSMQGRESMSSVVRFCWSEL